MLVPVRNTEQLAAIHRTLPPNIVAKLPRDHQGPPLDLFECGKEHARRNPGPHREPPLPILTRYDTHDEKAELVDSFFHWYSRFPPEPYPRGAEDCGRQACLIEVLPHGSYLREPPRDPKSKQGWGSRGNGPAAVPVTQELRRENEFPMYFLKTHDVTFPSSAWPMEHGSSWEVNVLGQKVTIGRGSKLEEESGNERESEGANEKKEIRETIYKVQKRLRKLEVGIEKSEEKGAKDPETKEATSVEKMGE